MGRADVDLADVDPAEVELAYRGWLPAWRIWASRARADSERRALHNTLHALAARLAQEGDALELVLATGLLTWAPPDGPPIREHLLSTRVRCEIDPVTSDIRVRLPADATTRLADGHLLDGVASFHRERTNNLHDRLRHRAPAPLGPDDTRLLREWLTLAVDVPAAGFDPQTAPPPPPPATAAAAASRAGGGSGPQVTFAPALVLRVRDSAALLSYYERMLDALRGDGPPPLGLAQLVATLDTDERLAWLAAEGATDGAVLGADPLLPLPTSPEQALVLERLRHDNGVVVEGPPGTGKTHTIANLICALLAEGQRVLVTSQKAQALRVLRAKLPPDLRDLCVSLTDTAEDTEDTGAASGTGGDHRADPGDVTTGIGAPELALSVSALAAQRAAYRPEALDRRIARATERRDQALRERDALAARARDVRAAEGTIHPDTAIAAGWGGTRASVAARVRAAQSAHAWLPLPIPTPAGRSVLATAGPPLTDDEAVELRALLRRYPADPSNPPRPTGHVDADESTWPVLAADRFATLVAAGASAQTAAATARENLTPAASALLATLIAASPASADELRCAVRTLHQALDEVHSRAARVADRAWVPAAVHDALTGHDRLVWAKIDTAAEQVAEAARQLTELGLHEVLLPAEATSGDEATASEEITASEEVTVNDDTTGDAAVRMSAPAVLLARGEALRAHFDDGGGLRRRFKGKAQRAAGTLLAQVTVDGLAPTTPELLDLVLIRLRAQLALDAAGRAWVLAGHPPQPGLPVEIAVSRLLERHEVIEAIGALVTARDHLLATAANHGDEATPTAPTAPIVSAITSAETIGELAAALAAEQPARAAAAAEAELTQVRDDHERLAAHPAAPVPLAALLAATHARDSAAYTAATERLTAQLAQDRATVRRDTLLARLDAAHPDLAQRLRTGPTDPPTGGKDRGLELDDFGAAWSWGLATGWLDATRAIDHAGTEPNSAQQPNSAAPADLDADLDAAEDVLAAATAELAGARAWRHCLERLGAGQSAALRAYSEAVAAGATHGGRQAERYRQAAREAMAIAQTAVPAWVMPIREVLSTIPPVRDSFDVVIVDEGSQAGLDSLFLLWLAPRVIVVGDDRQCTPAAVPGRDLDDVLDRLDALLPDVPAWLRVGFSPRSSLFSLLRTRFGEVVRLREHFRCMPEIIEWSSAMFYREAPLVPLRQFGADRLPPLVARHVPHGSTIPTSTGPRNRAEAEALVGQVLLSAQDPRNAGLTFGVVVMAGQAQATLIRDLLAERLSAAEHRRRRLRVGTPADFQGDERHVVFVSLVVAPSTPPTPLTTLEYQRLFNVAASRARDQVWLFHSVALTDLDQHDLRHSYLAHVLSTTQSATAIQLTAATRPGRASAPPGSPDPRLVPEDRPHPAFGSLLAQRVYRRVAGRGYLVAPQVEIGGLHLDLVVSGGRSRFAIGCDDDAGDADITRGFDRERDLRRVGWRFWRVRQSDFELNPEAALATLWPRLAAAGITPVLTPPDATPRTGPTPDGPTPDGTDPDGTDPDGTDPDGTDPDGAVLSDGGAVGHLVRLARNREPAGQVAVGQVPPP
ncbi:AAA domain-containing protein [Frankia sp. AgPm24]|uniref:AAA domain-containing protein n=1 Tax=Frankia sp. AgPm24 TaxID=631128 RepID=UPI0020100D41|nr:AAA domain-containing protein [Frankia sp. AgPm24]